ncbi:MAG TPA: xanthine dehydrogenase family protein molybdopterin-binding subunit [Candidatus Binatia bacterium]|nr:xanthine dehydrogenase family protein molybdopterin-binding subunit [Candidatus Binatia bacterium]
MGDRFIGHPVKRKEDGRLLTGKGNFVDDLKLPDMAHMAVLRSSQAHAKILKVHIGRACGARGVLAAFTASDLKQHNRAFPLLVPHPSLHAFTPRPLAEGKVRYVGEPIAVVAARTRAAAEDALDMIGVDYEPLPAAVCPEKSLEPGGPIVHESTDGNLAAHLTQNAGDVEAAMKQADLVVRERFLIKRGSGQSIEGRAIIVRYEPRMRTFTVWSATQAPHLHRRILAELFSCSEDKIHVIVPDVGGGFGPKGIFYPEDFLVAYLSYHLSRPVKWIEDRREHFLSAVHEREQIHEAELALRKDGTILAFRDHFIVDMGAYVPWGIIVPSVTLSSLLGPYRIPNFHLEAKAVYSNKVPIGQLRGAGRPQAVFVTERMVDIAAAKLGMDRVEIRLKNLIEPGALPYTPGLTYRDGSLMTYDSGDYPRCLRRALALSGHEGFRSEQEKGREEGQFIGLGMACFVEASGLGPLEGASVRVERSGRVTLAVGSPPQGQGHETTLAQVCADELGVGMENVDVTLGHTERLSYGTGTFASRTAVVGGNAVSLAARAVKEKAIRAASKTLGVAAQDLELSDGKVYSKESPTKSIALCEIAAIASGGVPGSPFPEGIQPGLEATCYFTPSQPAYASGAHVAVVRVDPQTGIVKVLRYAVAHDCGRVINPMIVDGQIHGGVAHGIGDILFENLHYDENGQLQTTSYLTYLIPTSTDVPYVNTAHVEVPSRFNALGVKGAGEAGAIGAPAAVANAIADALSPLGVSIDEFPLIPNRIWQLINASSANVARNSAGGGL